MSSEDWLSIGDVQRVLGLTPAGVEYHIELGRLRFFQPHNRGWRLFKSEDVQNLKKRIDANQSRYPRRRAECPPGAVAVNPTATNRASGLE